MWVPSAGQASRRREGSTPTIIGDGDKGDEAFAREVVSQRAAWLAAGLFIEDPEADSSLVFPVPQGVLIDRLLTSYDTKVTTGRKVRCAGCPSRTPQIGRAHV